MENNIKGKKILITVGPTREYLDPVRFITNESSRKMGYAIAEVLHNRGAEAIVVPGPVLMKPTVPAENVVHVITANEMFEACKQLFEQIDVAIFAAAVADYRPKTHQIARSKNRNRLLLLSLLKIQILLSSLVKSKPANKFRLALPLKQTMCLIMLP